MPRRGELTEKKLRAILEDCQWLDGLETKKLYRRKEDDSPDGFLSVAFSEDGDAWIMTFPDEKLGSHALRFRIPMIGGGISGRVRKALMILALAIKMDNEDDSSRRM